MSDLDQDPSSANLCQALLEEQTYRELMTDIKSFMGLTHIPDIDSTASTVDENLCQCEATAG